MNDSVGVACLPQAGEILAHGTHCFISGWGNLYSKVPATPLSRRLSPGLDYFEHTVQFVRTLTYVLESVHHVAAGRHMQARLGL